MIEQDIRQILVQLEGVSRRLEAIEEARTVAREVQDEWKDEVRDDLREIRAQTTATNGQVRKHELVLAHMGGVASVFSWWKAAVGAAVAGGVVAGVAYVLTNL